MMQNMDWLTSGIVFQDFLRPIRAAIVYRNNFIGDEEIAQMLMKPVEKRSKVTLFVINRQNDNYFVRNPKCIFLGICTQVFGYSCEHF